MSGQPMASAAVPPQGSEAQRGRRRQGAPRPRVPHGLQPRDRGLTGVSGGPLTHGRDSCVPVLSLGCGEARNGRLSLCKRLREQKPPPPKCVTSILTAAA